MTRRDAPNPRRPPRRRAQAFSLIEMLAVISVICVLSVAGATSTSSFFGSPAKQAVIEAAGLMEQARAYAITHNTHTYVGFAIQSGPDAKVVMAAFASPQGVNAVDFSAGVSIPASTDDLVLISLPKTFNQVALSNSSLPDQTTSLYKGGTKIGTPTWTFDNLIHFTPQGAALVSTTPAAKVAFALQPTQGSASRITADSFTVEVSGITGQVAVVNFLASH